MKNIILFVFAGILCFFNSGQAKAASQPTIEKHATQIKNPEKKPGNPSETTKNAAANTPTEIPVFATNIVLKNLIVPWEIRFLAKDHWLITERPGYLTILQGENIKRIKVPAVDSIGEGGLLGLAIHPDFNNNHWIYVYRTTEKNGKNYNQVVRYKLEKNTLAQEKIVIDDIPANSIHNGGRMAFGPDQYLYVTTGDVGQPQLSQDTTNLAGKILRVDAEGNIPSDNPFNNAVFSYGHHNPQGLTWDNKDRLWALDVGQGASDKLNLITKGKSYNLSTKKGKGSQNNNDYEKPILNSGTNTTWAPAGLAFWNGKLYFGGLKSEALYEVDLSTHPLKITKYFENQFGRIRAVSVGIDNALYLTTSNQDGQTAQKSLEDDIVIRIPKPRARDKEDNAKIDAEFPVSHSFR